MMTLNQIRKKYRPCTPVEALEDLAEIVRHPKKEGFKAPLLKVILLSGHSFSAFLINSSAKDKPDYSFVFSIDREGDSVSDLMFVLASRIEAVVFYKVEDYSGILPRFPKSATEPTSV